MKQKKTNNLARKYILSQGWTDKAIDSALASLASGDDPRVREYNRGTTDTKCRRCEADNASHYKCCWVCGLDLHDTAPYTMPVFVKAGGRLYTQQRYSQLLEVGRKHARDILQPYKINRNTGRIEINRDYIKSYGTKDYTESELRQL